MQFLPIVPYQLLSERTESAVFVESDWLDQPLYLESLVDLDNTLIILDNSVHLNHQPCDGKRLLELASMLPKCCVIAPDVQGNRMATLREAEQFAEQLDKLAIYKPTFMVVPQGRDYDDFVRCLEYMHQGRPDGIAITLDSSWCLFPDGCECQSVDNEPSDYLGVSIRGDPFLERAHHRVKMLHQLEIDRLIREGVYYHLLGMTHGLELAAIKRMGFDDWISSCDSSKAFTLAREGIVIGKDGLYIDKRKLDGFNPCDRVTLQVLKRTRLNIKRLQELLV